LTSLIIHLNRSPYFRCVQFQMGYQVGTTTMYQHGISKHTKNILLFELRRIYIEGRIKDYKKELKFKIKTGQFIYVLLKL